MLLKDGTCEKCPPFQTIAEDKMSCYQRECTHRERLLVSGECEPCEAYTRAILDEDNVGKICAAEICDSRQIILPDGTC